MAADAADIEMHERAPRTQAQLYPSGTVDGPVDPVGAHSHRDDADLAPLALLREGLVMFARLPELGLRVFALVTLLLMAPGAIAVARVAGVAGDAAIITGWIVAGVVWFVALLLVGFDAQRTGTAWSTWAEPRGGRALRVERHPSRLLQRFGRRWRRMEAWRLTIGARGVDVDVVVMRRSILEPRMPAAYVAIVQLPPAAVPRLGDASLVRRTFPHGVERITTSDAELALESIDLARGALLRVPPATRIEWVRVLDPPTVALLADLGVEFACIDGELVVHVAAPRQAWLAPDPRRLDALCLCAVELEERIATILGRDGVPVAPAAALDAARSRRAARARRVPRAVARLQRERQRDLELDPEELFAELARYASVEDVATVRAKVDSGEFPLEWLDDLVHHRRAAFWGPDEAGDSDSRAA